MSDWISPDTTSDVPHQQPVARPADREPDTVVAGRGPEMAPRTPTELIDHAFAFIRRHPRDVITASALFVVPFALIAGFLQRDVLGGASFIDVFSSNDPSVFADQNSGGGGDPSLQFLAFVGPSIGLVFVAAALARLVASERSGQPLDVGDAFVTALKLAPALIGSWILVHLVEGLGVMLLVLPGMAAVVLYSVVAPVIAIEKVGPVKAMRRSFRLVRRRFWPAVGVVLLSFVVESIVSGGLSLLPTLVAGLIGFQFGWIVVGVGSAAVGLITTPFVALVSIELYLDLRVRVEALDIEIRVPDLFEEA